MFNQIFKAEYKKPVFYFCISFCLVLMASWLPVFRGLDTFMQFWRVEIAASIFLSATLFYSLYQYSKGKLNFFISRPEMKFIVLPLAVFIVWSAVSMAWSPSWKLAAYHTLIWAEYLIFYMIIRRVLDSPKSYNLLITLLAIVLLIIAAPAIIEYCSFIYLGGATTLGIRFSKYGEFYLALFPVITAGVLRLKNRRFALGVFVVVTMWLFIIGTLGRTNLILFVAATMVIAGTVFLFKQFHEYRSRMAIIVLAMIIVPIPLHSITLLTEKPNVPIVSRVSDETGISYSNNFRKLMVSVSLEIIAAHPLIGIGAGTYGTQFNKYREIYAEKNSTDGNLTVAENELAERTHNEYLQIFAELGIVGSLIFAWFIASIGIMFWNAFRNFRQTSLLSLAALLGLTLFLASSAASSFSFRFMQNGLVFFFVFALAAKSLLSTKSRKKAIQRISFSNVQPKLAFSFGILSCSLLFGLCLVRVAGSVYTMRANQTADNEQAKLLYQTASALDNENPNADYFHGLRLVKDNRFAEAVPYFRRAIAYGLGTSSVYSYLATAQTLSGDNAGAEKTFAEATRLYPLSPFVRTRYATLLQANGKAEEARQQMDSALKINKKSAKTWWSLMNNGLPETTRTAFSDKEFVQVMDLTPPQSIEAVLTERNIKFPHEKVEFNFPD